MPEYKIRIAEVYSDLGPIKYYVYEGQVDSDEQAIQLFVNKVVEVIEGYGFIDYYEFDMDNVVRAFMNWQQEAYHNVVDCSGSRFKPCMTLNIDGRNYSATDFGGVIGRALRTMYIQ